MGADRRGCAGAGTGSDSRAALARIVALITLAGFLVTLRSLPALTRLTAATIHRIPTAGFPHNINYALGVDALAYRCCLCFEQLHHTDGGAGRLAGDSETHGAIYGGFPDYVGFD